ncbi:MAG TPA: Fe-S cluster assembly protein HesB [Planctomycetota bacterium]
MPHAHRCILTVKPPFELPLVLCGHGWFALAPHEWAGGTFSTILRADGEPVRAEVRAAARGLAVTLHCTRRLASRTVQALKQQLAHMLRLDDDLAAFWRLCAAHERLGWVAQRGGGRLLRSATVFEDLMKLLLTTNCTWSLTEIMVRNLVATAGPPGPDGKRAFPSALECNRGERFFRTKVKVGYRARAAAALARQFARGELRDEHFLAPELPTEELRERVQALDGFGPYAAGQALRLFGRYDDLALDSWCRARIAQLLGRRRAPADATIARLYDAFTGYRGLAMWCDLTAEWHGEGTRPGAGGLRGADESTA